MIDSRPGIYLDTDFFIRAVEGTIEAASPPRKLIDALRGQPGLALTSELTFAEVLAPPQRPGALALPMKRRVYFDLLIWSAFITLIPVSRDILIETSDLRSAKRMKLADSIHMVTAIRAQCRFIVTSDADFRGTPPDIEHVEPTDYGIERLLAAIA